MELSLNRSNINTLFPFFFQVNEEGVILDHGNSFHKIFGQVKGKHIKDLFEFKRPHLSVGDFRSIFDRCSQIFILQSISGKELLFRGQFIKTNDGKDLFFAGSPWVTSANDLNTFDLGVNDFALHNTLPDMLQIIRSKELAMEDYDLMLRSLNSQKEKLKTSTTSLQALIQSIQNGVLVETEDRKVMLTNEAFCKMFGIPVTANELVGADCDSAAKASKHMFEEEDLFLIRIQEILRNKLPVKAEILKLKDGRVFSRDFIPVFSQGEHLGHMWQYSDVTEEINTQLKISQSEDKFRRVIENLELGLLEVDQNNKIIKAYPGFCRITGFEESELLGKDAIELLASDKDKKLMVMENVKRKEGKSGVYEVRLRKKDGDFIWVTISGAPIYEILGEIRGSIGIYWDISERKAKETELKRAKIIAEKSVKAKQQFLANMSHEIRTPMNVIMGVTELLSQTTLSNEQQKDINTIYDSASHLLKIINDVLDLSKIESGKVELRKTSFDLRMLLSALNSQFSVLAHKKGISLLFDTTRLKHTFVKGDEHRISQILYNLLSNAIKFTMKGGVKLLVTSESSDGDSKDITLEFAVIDTGTGIAERDISTIFESFNQGSESGSQAVGGTGLGLAIVSELVRLHKGNITVESKIGKGSSFKVKLVLEISFDKKQIVEKAGVVESKDLKGLQVLLVEDNELNRMVAGRFLQGWNVSLDMALNGAEAVEMAGLKKYDAILMDVQMPIMDGYQATRAIRSGVQNKNTTIIGLTAHVLNDGCESCRQSGMNDVMTKPFDPNQLFLRLSSLVKQVSQTQEISDLTYLRDLAGENNVFLKETLQMFLKTTPEIFVGIKTALLSHNQADQAFHTHKIRSNLFMVGAASIQEKIEGLCDKNRATSASEIENVERELDLLYDEIEKTLNNY